MNKEIELMTKMMVERVGLAYPANSWRPYQMHQEEHMDFVTEKIVREIYLTSNLSTLRKHKEI